MPTGRWWRAALAAAALAGVAAQSLSEAAAGGWMQLVQQGFAAQSEGRWAEAASAYTSARQSGAIPASHQLPVASNLGLALQKTGRLDEALGIFDKVLYAYPANVGSAVDAGLAARATFRQLAPQLHFVSSPRPDTHALPDPPRCATTNRHRPTRTTTEATCSTRSSGTRRQQLPSARRWHWYLRTTSLSSTRRRAHAI